MTKPKTLFEIFRPKEEKTMGNKEQAIQDALHHPWTWCYRGKIKVRFIPEQNKLEVQELS